MKNVDVGRPSVLIVSTLYVANVIFHLRYKERHVCINSATFESFKRTPPLRFRNNRYYHNELSNIDVEFFMREKDVYYLV